MRKKQGEIVYPLSNTDAIPMDGINEKGLAISVNILKGEPTHQNTNKIGITTSTLIRLVLDYADSVESAIALISQYDLHDSASRPYHYQTDLTATYCAFGDFTTTFDFSL